MKALSCMIINFTIYQVIVWLAFNVTSTQIGHFVKDCPSSPEKNQAQVLDIERETMAAHILVEWLKQPRYQLVDLIIKFKPLATTKAAFSNNKNKMHSPSNLLAGSHIST